MEVARLTIDDIRVHNTSDDCWIAVDAKVWDITDFLGEHPGGSAILLKYAGSDATVAYNEIHAPGILENTLPVEKLKGQLQTSSSSHPQPVLDAKQNTEANEKPELFSLISAADFEKVAKNTLSRKAWAFYSSAATDLVTNGWNRSLLRRIMLRPRVLKNVSKTCMKRNILGCPSDAPFFISPAAMARLAHPDGELALARAAGSEGVIQCISSNASYPLPSITTAGVPDQPFFFQLYVNSDRSKTSELLRKVREVGVRAIFVTVDAPVPGKREADERIAAETVTSAVSGATASNDKKGGGMGRLMAQYIDKSLQWEDIAWIKETSGLPVILKGVQSAEDARLAVQYGVEGIMLSNHGGRSLDGAQPAIVVLLELHKYCPEVFDQLEILVDGGFERGSDILKALALGASAVGLGRSFLYALTYGEEGVSHLIQILKDELEVSMKLCGITEIDQAHPGLVNTADIEHLIRSGSSHPFIKWRRKANL